jgi:hypothetical protein
MEKELLNQMIHDRDRRISSIKRKMEDQHSKMILFEEELKEIKLRREASEVAHIEELTKLMEEKEAVEKTLSRLQDDLKKQQGDSLQLYAEVIKKDASSVPDATDSSYVMRMQAQLCKCMHSMGIMENQMELVKETCDELIKSLKEAVNRTIDEKTQVELQFMNELVMTDNSRREVEEGLKVKLEKLREEIQALEEKLEDRDSESESDSETDEEEEEEKELLKKELKERNEEITALQKEIDAQKERINLLETGAPVNGEVSEPKPSASVEPAEDGEEEDHEVTEDESTDS